MNMSITFMFRKWDALIKKHEHERQFEVYQGGW